MQTGRREGERLQGKRNSALGCLSGPNQKNQAYFILPRNNSRGGSGLYHTKLAIKSLKTLWKIVYFFMTAAYIQPHAQVVGGRRKQQFCSLDHEITSTESVWRSHNFNCWNTQWSLMLSILCWWVESMTHEVLLLLGKPLNSVTLKVLPLWLQSTQPGEVT